MASPLESFGCLDELIQIIYQSVHRFVLLSNVTEEEWTVHLGLSGSEGRWWRGVWKDKDVFETIGSISKATGKLLEGFAQKLADCVVNGDIFISDWSSAPGAQIKVKRPVPRCKPDKKPVHIPLTEISAAEAASFSTRMFLDIAIQAKSRKNQLHGGAELPALAVSSTFSTTDFDIGKPSASSSVKDALSASDEAPERKSPAKKREEKAGKSTKRKESEPPQPKLARTLKGASLVNPNKKARKFKAQEFESDGE
ncbi:hypothetical protein D9758_008483 [Tetrapyrgos nigripes]|uniref:Uncharacterized protein n=1 Tax=Tetrapyrgos nigripes TaxID=182062 RepID=A0A8H5CQ50_9AGAR|nr:hypothetical protein D9758_008483 [Tetrapyrgos nigripes]